MDISTISDMNELKAMAYDQIVVLEQAQANLKAINERIGQVERDSDKAEEPVLDEEESKK